MRYIKFEPRVILDGDIGMSGLEIQFDESIKKMKDKFEVGAKEGRG